MNSMSFWIKVSLLPSSLQYEPVVIHAASLLGKGREEAREASRLNGL